MGVADSAHLEHVEMRIGPAHRSLDGFMKFGECDVQGFNASPYQRLDTTERYLELINRLT